MPQIPEKGSGISASEDHSTVEEIETALKEAEALKAWWEDVEAGEAPIHWFGELLSESPVSKPTKGFFGEVQIHGRTVPVMGHVGNLFFDRPGGPPGRQCGVVKWMLDQVEEFALRYWLRTQTWMSSQPYPELGQPALPPYLQAFSWGPPAHFSISGEEACQWYFKPRDGGDVRAFPPGDRTAIVDLRNLETEYEWITIENPIFDFNIAIGNITDDFPFLVVPLKANVHSVTNANLTTNQLDPDPDTLGIFGFGLGIIKTKRDEGVLADAPDDIQPGLKQQCLHVSKTGEIRAKTLTIMRRPEKLVNAYSHLLYSGVKTADLLALDVGEQMLTSVQKVLDRLPGRNAGFKPLGSAIRLLNRLTGKQAIKKLGISEKQIEREILLKHAIVLQRNILHSRQIWMHTPNWKEPSDIPEWLKRGELDRRRD